MANSSSCFQVHGAGFTRTMAHTMLQKKLFLEVAFQEFWVVFTVSFFGVNTLILFIYSFIYYTVSDILSDPPLIK